MIRAFLVRDSVGSDCILGTLFVGLEVFHVLERPWLDNESNISCIPAGDYVCNFMARSSSGKYKKVYWLQDVESRFGILIHNGNTVNHTKGCLIIGRKRGWLAGSRAVLNSKSSLRDLNEMIGDKPFKLTILGEQQCSIPS